MKIVGNINKGIELMDRVAPIPTLPKLNCCTSAMAGNYFNVTSVTISNFLKRHTKNLERLGLHKVEPSTLFEAGYIYLRPGKWDFDGDPYYFYAGYEREKQVSHILPPECLLYMAHRLKNSEVAEGIREATDGIISFEDEVRGVSSSNIGAKCSVSANNVAASNFLVSTPILSHNGIEYFESNGVVLFNSKSVLNILWEDAKPQGVEQVAKFLMENCHAEEIGGNVFIDMAGVTMLAVRAADKSAAKRLIDDIAMNIMPEMNKQITQKMKEEVAVTTATAAPSMVIRMDASQKEGASITSETANSVNGLMIYENQSFGTVRALEIDGEPWFVAADVCKALEIANPTQSVSRLDDDERAMLNIGRQGNTNIINEPGLLSLILGSRKPEAKAFKRWITHDVIPAIRKHGMYMTDATLAKAADREQFEKMMEDYKRDQLKLKEAKEWAALLEEDNTRLCNELKTLEKKTTFWELRGTFDMGRKMINKTVRKLRDGWSPFYNSLAVVLNEDVRERAAKANSKRPIIESIKYEEMPLAVKTLSELCRKYDRELTDMMPQNAAYIQWCFSVIDGKAS